MLRGEQLSTEDVIVELPSPEAVLMSDTDCPFLRPPLRLREGEGGTPLGAASPWDCVAC
jgi:hypothetical protein